MAKEVIVSKIVFKMGDVSVELSLEEAKELQKLLNDTLGKQESVFVPTVMSYPVYPRPYPWGYYEVSYDTTDGNSSVAYELVS